MDIRHGSRVQKESWVWSFFPSPPSFCHMYHGARRYCLFGHAKQQLTMMRWICRKTGCGALRCFQTPDSDLFVGLTSTCNHILPLGELRIHSLGIHSTVGIWLKLTTAYDRPATSNCFCFFRIGYVTAVFLSCFFPDKLLLDPQRFVIATAYSPILLTSDT